jgi:hypothetical protein
VTPVPARDGSPGVLHAALHDAATFDWSRFQPLAALYCVPAIVGLLVAGQLSGRTLDGLIAGSGAITVGFGAFQHLTRLRAAPMLLAAGGIAVSAAVGTLVSGVPVLEAVTAGVWGFALGLFAALGTASWWVLLQCGVALVIATTFPDDLYHAGLRAALVLAGSVAQIVAVSALWLVAPRPFRGMAPPNEELPPRTLTEAWRTLKRAAGLRTARLRYCAALGVSTAAGVVLFRLIGLENGYWIPMTVLIVLRWGGLRLTLGRALARALGTFAGAGVATLFAALVHPAPATLIILIVITAWACYSLQWVNYAAFSIGMTAYVVFGFAIAGLPEPLVAAHRALATLVGALVGVAGQLAIRAADPDAD